MKERLKKTVFYGTLLLSAGILYFIWYQGTGLAVPCFFHVLTGLYCPGCGMTRCMANLLLGNFREAFYYNMAVCLLSPLLIYFLGYSLYAYIRHGRIPFSGIQNLLLGFSLTVLVLFGILRNLPAFAMMAPGYGIH